ncbi:MAG: HlyD family efflux transporter periplasmic adaptor subunit [Lentisphaeria bacterium]|nr:HlyD family efflux transporter periplasmic adaptor subunit [Lentisphaeria bacterium]
MSRAGNSFSEQKHKAGASGIRSKMRLMLILTAIGGGAVVIAGLALLLIEIEDTIFARGAVVPEHTYEIVGHLDAQVKKFNFRTGDDVKTGDVIAELDTRSYESSAIAADAEIKELAAELELKKTELAILEKEPLPKELWYAAMNHKEASERSKRLLARLDRSKKLQLVSAISLIEFEKVEMEAIAGEGELARAKKNLQIVNSGLGKLYIAKAKREIALVEAKLAGKKAELAFLQKCIRDCRIVAPADGRLVLLPSKNSWYVSQGKVAAIIAAGNKSRARCKVDVNVVRKVKPGQLVRVTSDVYNRLQYGEFLGKVRWISDVPDDTDPNQIRYIVEVELDPEGFHLKYGSGVEVAIITGKQPAMFALLNLTKESEDEELRRRKLSTPSIYEKPEKPVKTVKK